MSGITSTVLPRGLRAGVVSRTRWRMSLKPMWGVLVDAGLARRHHVMKKVDTKC